MSVPFFKALAADALRSWCADSRGGDFRWRRTDILGRDSRRDVPLWLRNREKMGSSKATCGYSRGWQIGRGLHRHAFPVDPLPWLLSRSGITTLRQPTMISCCDAGADNFSADDDYVRRFWKRGRIDSGKSLDRVSDDPPSQGYTAPVIYDAAEEQRNSARSGGTASLVPIAAGRTRLRADRASFGVDASRRSTLGIVGGAGSNLVDANALRSHSMAGVFMK